MTLRSLYARAIARRREAWSHTSSLLAMVYNRTRFFSKEPQKSPDDFNPYAPRKKPVSVKDKFAAMKQRFMAFVQQQAGKEAPDGIRQ